MARKIYIDNLKWWQSNCSIVNIIFIVYNDFQNSEQFLYLIKEMATSCSSVSVKKLRVGHFFYHFLSCMLQFSVMSTSWVIFILNCTVPLFLEVFLCVLYFGTPKGNLRQWETQLHQSPGPCCCLHWVHAHHHSETDSSDPPPRILDHCSQTDLDLSFSNCLGLESEQNLHRPAKGSWREMISGSHCSPGECWLCCYLR
jgi:hypothetical protein